jgi:hypothetical protein
VHAEFLILRYNDITIVVFDWITYIVRDRTIKFTNSPLCACHGSTGQKLKYGLMTWAYQRFTAVLLLIYGSLFLSGSYYCLRVFWYAAARISELELEQRTNIDFFLTFGNCGNEIRECSAYRKVFISSQFDHLQIRHHKTVM